MLMVGEEQAHPGDGRPRRAIEQARAWARGEITMTQARTAAYAAHDAAREASGSAKEAARAAGHAVAVAHMADHELGAAAYAIRAVRAAADPNDRDDVGRAECRWQRAQLPVEIRDLVLDDERLRNRKCSSSAGRQRYGSTVDGRRACRPDVHIAVGDAVEVAARDGSLVITPVHRVRGGVDLAQLIARIPEGCKPEELDWGAPTGREIW